MKEAIEELIERYESRAKTLGNMLTEIKTEATVIRLTAKKGTYQAVIQDLKQILKDEDET